MKIDMCRDAICPVVEQIDQLEYMGYILQNLLSSPFTLILDQN